MCTPRALTEQIARPFEYSLLIYAMFARVGFTASRKPSEFISFLLNNRTDDKTVRCLCNALGNSVSETIGYVVQLDVRARYSVPTNYNVLVRR